VTIQLPYLAVENYKVQKGTNGRRSGEAGTAGTGSIMMSSEPPENKKKKANELMDESETNVEDEQLMLILKLIYLVYRR
jgi:hypothetical protein